MKAFANLYQKLDQTNKTNRKIEILVDFFKHAPEKDKLWTIYFLTGNKLNKPVNSTQMKVWAREIAGIPEWLFKESYTIVGDSSETIARILPEPKINLIDQLSPTDTLSQTELELPAALSNLEEDLKSAQPATTDFWVKYLEGLNEYKEPDKKLGITWAWQQLNQNERLVLQKLMSRSFRVGVSKLTVANALEKISPLDKSTILHRLSGNWHPSKTTFQELIMSKSSQDDLSKPYPFCLAYQLGTNPAELGAPDKWTAEWKWDGIRAQLIVRKDTLFVWSRGEELATENFPEFHPLTDSLPNGVAIDGEIVVMKDGVVQTFNDLQPRISRKNLTNKILAEHPVQLIAYDLLEYKGEDIRKTPFSKRRTQLSQILDQATSPTNQLIHLSKLHTFKDWDTLAKLRANSRAHQAEGLMLKRRDSIYHTGRKKGDWFKWKVDPFTMDVILIYAQRGSGRRANLYTDYTFAVWDDTKQTDNELVPIAKAYSGLTDEEIKEVDTWVREHTRETFGPVRSVEAELVFEIGFEGIRESSRHKSGISVRFPRILRRRPDKPKEEADTLSRARELLGIYES